MPFGDVTHNLAATVEGSSIPLVDVVVASCVIRFGLDGELEWGRLDGRGLRVAAEELQRAISALQHHQRRVLRLVEERRAYEAVGSRDAADWAAGQLGISRHTASEQIDMDRKLDELPHLADKAAAGELSAEQVKPAIELAADTIHGDGDDGEEAPAGDGGMAERDRRLADAAPSMSVATLRRRAARRRRPAAKDHAEARRVRNFESWTAGQELRFRGSLPLDDGARLLKAIERQMPDRDGTTTPGQRHADGLLALASATIAADADPDRATVVVIAELAAICDDDPAATAELETGQPLATDTARRLVCDSRLSVLVQDRDGRAVGLGTTARTVTPALRRALVVRDGHCRFGDGTSRRFLHAHHIAHWPAPTVMSNLALVCYAHHHALHEGGWHLTGDPFHELVAVHPDGRHSPPNHPHHHDHSDLPPEPTAPSHTGPPGTDTTPNRRRAPLSGGSSPPPHRPAREPALFADSG